MHKDGDEIHVDTDEVRGGSSSGVVRWVLIIGVLLAIVMLSVVWITGAATTPSEAPVSDVSGQVDPTE